MTSIKTRTELFPINRTFLPSSLYLSSRTGDLTKVTTLRTHITTWTLNLHESYPSLDNMPQTTQRGRAEKLVLYQTIIVDIAPLQLL